MHLEFISAIFIPVTLALLPLIINLINKKQIKYNIQKESEENRDNNMEFKYKRVENDKESLFESSVININSSLTDVEQYFDEGYKDTEIIPSEKNAIIPSHQENIEFLNSTNVLVKNNDIIEQKNGELNITVNRVKSLKQAIVMSEILGKPKSLR